LAEDPETGELVHFGPEDGNVMSKTPIPVPGGLSGVPSLHLLPTSLGSLETLGTDVGGVTATTEVAGPPSAVELSIENLISNAGIAIQMPVQIKLNNPLLGEDC
jgi:hypothetical protein